MRPSGPPGWHGQQQLADDPQVDLEAKAATEHLPRRDDGSDFPVPIETLPRETHSGYPLQLPSWPYIEGAQEGDEGRSEDEEEGYELEEAASAKGEATVEDAPRPLWSDAIGDDQMVLDATFSCNASEFHSRAVQGRIGAPREAACRGP